MLGGRGKIGLKLLFDLFMSAKGDYWWKLLSPGISYFWFDHLEALQGRKNPLLEMTLLRGIRFYSGFFFPPSECYITSYSSVFFFKVLVHEVHIKVLIPHWLWLHLINNKENRVDFIVFFFHVFVFICARVCVFIYAQCECVCKCECVREQEIVTDWKPKLFGLGKFKDDQINRIVRSFLLELWKLFTKYFLFTFVLFV